MPAAPEGIRRGRGRRSHRLPIGGLGTEQRTRQATKLATGRASIRAARQNSVAQRSVRLLLLEHPLALGGLRLLPDLAVDLCEILVRVPVPGRDLVDSRKGLEGV